MLYQINENASGASEPPVNNSGGSDVQEVTSVIYGTGRFKINEF
jgi:hypothetical protein